MTEYRGGMSSDSTQQDGQRDETRESIWSVDKRVRRLYTFLFSLSLIAGAVYVLVWHGVKNVVEFWQLVAPLILVSAGLSVVMADVVIGGMMAITDWVLERRRKRQLQREREHRERERERRELAELRSSLEETRSSLKQWEDWNARRVEAEQNGGGFDEPPPTSEDRSLNGQ